MKFASSPTFLGITKYLLSLKITVQTLFLKISEQAWTQKPLSRLSACIASVFVIFFIKNIFLFSGIGMIKLHGGWGKN